MGTLQGLQVISAMIREGIEKVLHEGISYVEYGPAPTALTLSEGDRGLWHS